jgi:hypothetical protein
MAAIHDELEAEGIQYYSDGAYLTRGRLGAGRFYVTGKRVVFLRQNPLFSLGGVIGAVLAAKVKPKKVGLDVPLSAITGVQRGTVVRNKNVLEISHGNDKPSRIAVKSYDTAVAAMKAGGARIE